MCFDPKILREISLAGLEQDFGRVVDLIRAQLCTILIGRISSLSASPVIIIAIATGRLTTVRSMSCWADRSSLTGRIRSISILLSIDSYVSSISTDITHLAIISNQLTL